jgi:allantoin racemase
MKHIRIIEAFVQTEEWLEVLQQVCQRYAREDLTLSFGFPDSGPKLEAHESLTALNLAIPQLIKNAIRAEQEGIDGIMIDCMADPGVEVLRESVSIPVLGPGHTSMYAAAMLGQRFSMLVTTEFSARYFLQHVHKAGLGSRLASIHAVGIAPEEIEADPERTVEQLLAAAVEAITVARADTLILGCTGFVSHAETLRQKLKAMQLSVALIDPFAITINMLVALTDARLTQSKIAYPDTGIGKFIHTHGIPGVVASD